MRAPMLGKLKIMIMKPAITMAGKPNEKTFKLGAARVATPKPTLMNKSVTMTGNAVSKPPGVSW